MAEISFPSEKTSCYKFGVKTGGFWKSAYLTYRISDPDPARDLLLMAYSDFDNGSLSADDRRALDGLWEQIGLYQQAGFGAIGGAKALVNQIASGWRPFPAAAVAVAVHRYGPVPVCLLPQEHDVPLYGKTRRVRIALYRDVRGEREAAIKLPAVFNRIQFLQSLRVNLPLTFTRYLEDIGEEFFDIENHCSLGEVFERARNIERVLGESVKSKLEEVWTSAGSRKSGPESQEAKRLGREILTQDTTAVAVATYARLLALFLLNELYEVVGLQDRSSKYRTQINEFGTAFGRKLEGVGAGSCDKPFELAVELEQLGRVAEQYMSSATIVDAKAQLWVQRFIQFGRFVADIRANASVNGSSNRSGAMGRRDFRPQLPRVFVSTLSKVPSADVLYAQIERYVSDRHAGRVHLLHVRAQPGGTVLRPVIRSRIWLSTTVRTVIPADPREWGDRQKDYKWIAREVEHGLLLGKEVVHTIEEGINKDDLRKTFADPDLDYLAPEARVAPDQRVDRLIRSLDEPVWVTFVVKDARGDYPPEDVQIAVDKLVAEAPRRRTDEMIKGYLLLLPPEVLRALPVLRRSAITMTGKAARKDWIGTILEQKGLAEDRKGQAKFARLYEGMTDRVLIIDDEDYTIMRHNKHTQKYDWRLPSILVALRPDASPEDLRQWETELLEWAGGQG